MWTVKDIVGDAIAISFVGFVLGPFYPIIMNVLVAILPVEITGGAIGESTAQHIKVSSISTPSTHRICGSRWPDRERPLSVRRRTTQRALRRVVIAAIVGGYDGYAFVVLDDRTLGLQKSLEGQGLIGVIISN